MALEANDTILPIFFFLKGEKKNTIIIWADFKRLFVKGHNDFKNNQLKIDKRI